MGCCFFDLSTKILRQENIFHRNMVTGNFIFNGNPLTAKNVPHWGMSLLKAGSMRFRWNEQNENRHNFLERVASMSSTSLTPVSIELIHSKTVFTLNCESESQNKQGDGIITKNQHLMPTVTVADCMPIFLYDIKSGCFGALHSGWRGTGIIQTAIEKACQEFCSEVQNICVVLGPHIGPCCYIIDEERAEYFSRNFCKECIEFVEKAELSSSAIPQWSADCKKLYRLSLAKANLAILKALGVPEKNIAVCNDCTCCTTFADTTENSEKNAKSSHIYGSFRRQTAFLPENIKIEERWKHFTVQAAFCGYLF